MIEAMIASRSAVKRPSMGFNMPKKHVLAISAVVVVAVAAAWLMPGRSKAPTTGAPANEQAQLPLGQGSPNAVAALRPSNSPAIRNRRRLPLVGNSQPVMRAPLAEAAGGITEGDDGVPVEGSSATPPTVTTIAPPAGVPAWSCANASRQTDACADPGRYRQASACAGCQACSSPAPAKPAAVAAKPAEKPATAAKAAGGTWYAGQAPGNYVVQILGTSSKRPRKASSRSRAASTVISRKSSTASRSP